MFHGPRAMVPDFFEALGFRCPERKGEADFLQEVTSRRDQAVRCASMLFVYSMLSLACASDRIAA